MIAVNTGYHLGGYFANAPQQNRAEEWNGPAGTYTTWDTNGVQTSQRPLTANEVAAITLADTDASQEQNQGTLTATAHRDLTANADYLALLAPTVLQQAAQINALTRECSALIRLLTGAVDTTAGT